MAAQDEMLVPFAGPRESLPPVTKCKSTLIVSSLRTLEEHGHLARYEQLLAPAYHDVILPCVAGVWLPIEAAVAHYEACEALGLPAPEVLRMGAAVSERIQQSALHTLIKLAHSSGVTPWMGLRQFHRLFERIFVGGGTSVARTGPKDARIEIVGLPLARVPYFVNGYRGVIQAGGELFASRVYVTTIPRLSSATTLGFRVAWA